MVLHAGPVLARPLFQEGSKCFSANEESKAWLRIGLEDESWNTSKAVRRASKLCRSVRSSFGIS